MSAAPSRLVVRPDRCDRCGLCVRACPRQLVRVTSGYVHIDTSACIECLACADVCPTGAITKRSVRSAGGAGPALRPSEVPAVAVGSRAEAKALRRAAADAQKRTEAEKHRASRQAKVIQSAAEIEQQAAADGTALWSLGEAAGILALIAVLLVAKQAAISSAMVSVMPASGQVVARSALLGVFYAIQLAALAFLAGRHSLSPARAFGLGRLERSASHRLVSAALVVVLLIATRLASLLWSLLARAVGWDAPARSDLPAVFGSGTAGLALSVVMVVIAAPVVEELVFRGVVMRSIGYRFGRRPAIVGSAVVFALSHATAWAFVPVLVLGVALGWLAWTRESLWPAIALHVLYNGVVVAAAFWVVR